MKFLRDRSFKRLSIYFLAAFILLFISEYLIVTTKVNTYHENEARRDFARKTQLEGQQLMLLAQRHVNNNESLTAPITAQINRINHDLKILKEGGRIEDADVFISELPRIPLITFTNLDESWKNYHKSLSILLTEEALIDSTIVVPPAVGDTVHSTPFTTEIQFTNGRYKTALTLLSGQGVTLTEWFNKLIDDVEEKVLAARSSLKSSIIWLMIINSVLVAAALFFLVRKVLTSVEDLTATVASRQPVDVIPPNEVGVLTKETNLLLEQLQDASEFVALIGEGKLDAAYKQREGQARETNTLASALTGMQAKLKALNDEEKKRQWATEGLTRFVDIVRNSDNDITRLGDEIIAALVKYTNSNQGGLYSLNDDDERNKYLELVALFAFDSKKFEKKQIRLGEGILGQTFLERETTLLTEIPEDYVRITSGLGDGGPKAILMVPLKVDQKVYGMVELASFSDYDSHEIAFVEKLGETIASTLATVKAAQKNKQLIEQFQQQTEQMRAQEEEMRQNMEELTATQEEMSRKERDYIDRIRELENNNRNTIPSQELETAREELRVVKQQYTSRIDELQRLLDAKPSRSDDWAIAEEVERSLKVNLDALKITQEELNRKAGKN